MTLNEKQTVRKYLDHIIKSTTNYEHKEFLISLYNDVFHLKIEPKYSGILDSNPCGEIPLTGEPPTVK